MKISTLFVVVLLTACCHRQGTDLHDVGKFPRQAYESTGSITSSTGRVAAAGIIVRCRTGQPLIVLTAAHVVRNRPLAWFQLDKSRVPVTPFRIDETKDLALLAGPTRETACREATLGDVPGIGDTLWLIGSLTGRHRNVSRGVVSGGVAYQGAHYIVTDADAFYGSSGGGAFDVHGRLVGIVSKVAMLGRIVVIPGSTMVVHTSHLMDIMRGV